MAIEIVNINYNEELQEDIFGRSNLEDQGHFLGNDYWESITLEEMNKGTYSKNYEIKNWWITHYAEIEFLKQMKYELKKYEIEIMKESMIDLKEVPLQENKSETIVEEKELDTSKEKGSEDKKENKTEEEA